MIYPISLSPDIIERFKCIFNDDEIIAVCNNVFDGIFTVYSDPDGQTILIAEFDCDNCRLHLVGIVGRNINALLDALFQKAKDIHFNILFKTRKPSFARLVRRFNPVLLGSDKDDVDLLIYEVLTNG